MRLLLLVSLLAVLSTLLPLSHPPYQVQASHGGLMELREGDLLFRAGRGWRAEVVRTASNSILTHVGIVDVADDGQVYIIHAEPPEGSRAGRVRRQSLEVFAGSQQATALIAYRPALTEKVLSRAVSAARRASDLALPFDDEFDLKSDEAMYCSELIWKAFVEAGVPLKLVQTHITFPGKTGYYLMPEDIMAMIPGHQI